MCTHHTHTLAHIHTHTHTHKHKHTHINTHTHRVLTETEEESVDGHVIDIEETAGDQVRTQHQDLSDKDKDLSHSGKHKDLSDKDKNLPDTKILKHKDMANICQTQRSIRHKNLINTTICKT